MLLKKKRIFIFLLCFSILLSFVTPPKTVATVNDTKSISWLQKQLDLPKYPLNVKLDKDYPLESIDNIKGYVDTKSLDKITLKNVPYISINSTYASGYYGEISGNWSNIDDIQKYSVVIYDQTDANYKIATVSLNSNGTFRTDPLTIHGKAIITLVDSNNNFITKASLNPLMKVIDNYEVWIYSTSDIPYLQTKLPIRADGTFSTEDADLTFSHVNEGTKVARVVRKSDGKVLGTTELPRYNLIRSYNVPIDDPVNTLGIDRRSWIYDDALAVISFSMNGDRERAYRILSSLSELQNGDGSLAFSYDIFTGPLDDRKRSGSIAWVGDAAVKYEETFGDSSFRPLATSIATYLISQQDKSTGSIKGGPDVSWYSTEHNIDAYFFFRNLGNLTGNLKYLKTASLIEKSLLTYHWNKTEKRFNQGINDEAAALDTNSWGSIFLEAIGRTDLSKTVTSYLANFEVNNSQMSKSSDADSYNQTYESSMSLSGYKPYAKGYADAPNIVWTEGTWGVINLFKRQNRDTSTLINSMFTMQAADKEGGLVYTNKGYAPYPYEFHVWPSVAPTAWQYITLKDPKGIWNDNKRDSNNEVGDILEYNNTIETAREIGLYSFKNLTLHNKDDVDYYKFTPYFNDKIKISINNILDYKIDVITPDNTITSHLQSNYQVADVNLKANKTYYIKVYSPHGEGNAEKPYSLNLIDNTEFDFMVFLDQLNNEIAKKDIEKMQTYLQKMGFYSGAITGEYSADLFMSVSAYQSTLNKWDPRTSLNGKFSEDGIINDRLLVYASDDVELGRDKDGSIYRTLFMGDALILSWGIDEGIGIGAAALSTSRVGKKVITRTLAAVSEATETIGGKLLKDSKQFRSIMPNSSLRNGGNIGIADIEINGEKFTLKAHSRINTKANLDKLDSSIQDGIVLEPDLTNPDTPTFKVLKINNAGEIDGEHSYFRFADTEYKIISELAKKIGDNWNTKGTINLFTERNPCRSCSGVIDQFQDRYPNIKINVYYDETKYNHWE